MSHTFLLEATNNSSLLLRVSGVFARRGYSIYSLTLEVGETREVCRMLISTACSEMEALLLVSQLNKLIDVRQVKKV